MVRTVCLTLAALALTAATASAQTLNVGDPAPKLDLKEFVKGEPVKAIEKGKVHVVEFWATWCGPCVRVFPHLTDLQKKHKDVVFIGVNVWEPDLSKVKPFVEKQGERMGYRVAIDNVPEGAEKGKMAINWMEAAGQEGIPAAFIVNQDGIIAWIGHPASMDKVLDEVVAGNFDIKKAAERQKKEASQAAKLQSIGAEFSKAAQAGKFDDALAVLDKALAEDPSLEERVWSAKFRVLMQGKKDQAAAAKYVTTLVEKVLQENKDQLNNVAWMIVDPKAQVKAEGPLLKAALAAAQQADKLAGGKEGAIADTLAKAYFDNGDVAKALETQERAVKLSGSNADQELKDRLEQYRKAAAEKK